MTRDELLTAYASGRRDFRGADLRGANLIGADLRGADLSGADLSGADLRGADLSGADLSGADLSGADLRVADLSGADLRVADLSGADLRVADLGRADLGRANLSRTDLGGAYLGGAYLGGAYLGGANLSRANLSEADLGGATLPHFAVCPEVGPFTAFKALREGAYAELFIPADAPRTSSLVGRKCRAAWVEVVALYDRSGNVLPPDTIGYGLHDGTEYRVGETVIADGWDDDIRVECTHGIHFFITLREAHDYA
ncbi:MAG: pentapeptide repeat-containing protein [Gemmatimonadaceae bacterium]